MEAWIVIGFFAGIGTIGYAVHCAKSGTIWMKWFGHIDEKTEPITFWIVWLATLMVAILGGACCLYLIVVRSLR